MCSCSLPASSKLRRPSSSCQPKGAPLLPASIVTHIVVGCPVTVTSLRYMFQQKVGQQGLPKSIGPSLMGGCMRGCTLHGGNAVGCICEDIECKAAARNTGFMFVQDRCWCATQSAWSRQASLCGCTSDVRRLRATSTGRRVRRQGLTGTCPRFFLSGRLTSSRKSLHATHLVINAATLALCLQVPEEPQKARKVPYMDLGGTLCTFHLDD